MLQSTSFVQGGTAPACSLVRASSAVFRLYANASLAGASLTVTSCSYTTAGDPVVSVVSSTSPTGPYTCVANNDNSACGYGFTLSVPLTAGLYYFFSFVTAGTAPLSCALARSTAVIFRLYAAQAGTLTASGCGLTFGDPVVSIVSSTARTGGTFACEGNNDDSICGSPFTLTVPLRADAYYYVVVGPYSLTALPTMRVNLTGSGVAR
ncbi:hypothetical protein ABPG75_004599 [Micractinium tetrahymenae]